MQVETPEVSVAKASTSALQPGDRATFAVVRQTGRNVSISVKEVTILEIHEDRAFTKYRNGQKVWVLLKHLTPADKRNALTRALCGED